MYHVHARGVTANDIAMRYILHMTLTMITFQGNMAKHPEFPDPLSPHAGDTIHPALQK